MIYQVLILFISILPIYRSHEDKSSFENILLCALQNIPEIEISSKNFDKELDSFYSGSSSLSESTGINQFKDQLKQIFSTNCNYDDITMLSEDDKIKHIFKTVENVLKFDYNTLSTLSESQRDIFLKQIIKTIKEQKEIIDKKFLEKQDYIFSKEILFKIDYNYQEMIDFFSALLEGNDFILSACEYLMSKKINSKFTSECIQKKSKVQQREYISNNETMCNKSCSWCKHYREIVNYNKNLQKQLRKSNCRGEFFVNLNKKIDDFNYIISLYSCDDIRVFRELFKRFFEDDIFAYVPRGIYVDLISFTKEGIKFSDLLKCDHQNIFSLLYSEIPTYCAINNLKEMDFSQSKTNYINALIKYSYKIIDRSQKYMSNIKYFYTFNKLVCDQIIHRNKFRTYYNINCKWYETFEDEFVNYSSPICNISWIWSSKLANESLEIAHSIKKMCFRRNQTSMVNAFICEPFIKFLKTVKCPECKTLSSELGIIEYFYPLPSDVIKYDIIQYSIAEDIKRLLKGNGNQNKCMHDIYAKIIKFLTPLLEVKLEDYKLNHRSDIKYKFDRMRIYRSILIIEEFIKLLENQNLICREHICAFNHKYLRDDKIQQYC